MSERIELISHSETPPQSTRSVSVHMRRGSNGVLFLTYEVEPAETLLLPDHLPGVRDRLWESTCFELFLKTVGGGYREYNFTATAWYAQTFTEWRRGKPFTPAHEPTLVDCRIDDRARIFPRRYELDVVLAADDLQSVSKISLTAVIEEKSGRKSYWALAHPPGDRPDFHHPACFVLELPPPAAS